MYSPGEISFSTLNFKIAGQAEGIFKFKKSFSQRSFSPSFISIRKEKSSLALKLEKDKSRTGGGVEPGVYFFGILQHTLPESCRRNQGRLGPRDARRGDIALPG